jgi:type II secretory pathway pseudopilin PulG
MFTDRKGFTLSELLVASVLFIILTTGILVFMDSFRFMLKQNETEMAVLNQARLTIKEMVEGVNEPGIGRVGIWGATNAVVLAPTFLQYTGIDGFDRRIAVNGSNIVYANLGTAYVQTFFDYNGPAINDANEFTLNLRFSQVIPDVINIDLIMNRRVLRRWVNVSLTTQIAIRN